MYERFFNLRERPFSLTPDPDYLYRSRIHAEGLSYLRYGIEGYASFIVITGEIGCGKTTLLQTALRGLDQQTCVARIVNTQLDARDLLESVMLDFGLDSPTERSKPRLVRDLARFLVEQRSQGRLALLVIDEAQNLDLKALEEVRMLSNLETEKSKLIQIALVGQPELRDKLGRPELQQLRQRVSVSYHLRELDAPSTACYIQHRLRKASIGDPVEFPAAVSALIHRHSEGVPRKINIIADAVLLYAYGDGRHTIGLDLAREAIAELEQNGVIAVVQGGVRTLVAPPPAAPPDLFIHPPPVPEPRVVQERLTGRRTVDHGQRPIVRQPAARRPPAPVAQQRIVMPPRFLQPPEPQSPAPGLWGWLRRGLLGHPKPVLED